VLWGILTLISYIIMKHFKKNEKEECT